jgi:serine/threonine protein kinase
MPNHSFATWIQMAASAAAHQMATAIPDSLAAAAAAAAAPACFSTIYRWSQDAQGNEYMVMELVPLGSLDTVLLHFGEILRTRVKLSMCEQICSAMAELSAEGVLHRDLAARNVLVASLDPVHVKVRHQHQSRQDDKLLNSVLPVVCVAVETAASGDWNYMACAYDFVLVLTG